MRVLLIEDDFSIINAVKNAFSSSGYTCDCCDLEKNTIEIGKTHDYDLVILDIMLPEISGYDVLRRIRTMGINTPIIVLSGLSDVEDKVKGLGFGADDYITKPFNKMELLARAHAVVRRFRGQTESMIKVGDLVINLGKRSVTICGVDIDLTTKEYSVLEILALRKGKVVSKEMFVNHLYGGTDEPDPKIIDVFVCKIRNKISKVSKKTNYIETIWGRGHILNDICDISQKKCTSLQDNSKEEIYEILKKRKKIRSLNSLSI